MKAMSENNKITVQFFGAAGTVTGSKHLLEYNGLKILVDCGLFQGTKELRKRNWETLPFDASSLDGVLLTHGHLDHVGYLPLLVKQGFSGPIYATHPTMDIARLILFDSARIQEEDAERANKGGYSKHHPAKPLYTTTDVEAVIPLFRQQPLDTWIPLSPESSFRMHYNGHILGSVFIELKMGDKTLVFSGDLGRPEDPLLHVPQKPRYADIVFIEATYGNKIHPGNPKHALADAINNAIKKPGVIIIPSFAVERTQLIMHYITQLRAENAIPVVPVYMDSPMAAHVMDAFAQHTKWHRLSPAEYGEIRKNIRIITRPDQTEKLVKDRMPKIVIAAAGMASGGRVLSYFEHFIEDHRTTILLVGHQAEGTRGRALLDGAARIKMRGRYLDVRADIVQVQGLSAHADRNELTGWLSDLTEAPEQIFIIHAENDGANGLKDALKREYGYTCTIPQLQEQYTFPATVSESLKK
jgi:metallo-beta-lactamase family protein